MLGFSGTDSDEEEKDNESTVETTVISKSPTRTPIKPDNNKSGTFQIQTTLNSDWSLIFSFQIAGGR